MKPLNIAIAGLRFGRTWLSGFRNHPACHVVKLCDSDLEVLERSGRESGVEDLVDDLEAVVADPNVDCVAVFTPAPLHAQHSVLALRGGKHVLSAVPAAISEEGCRDICEAARTSGKTYMMAENWPYEPSIIRARELFHRGDLGTLFYGEAEYIHHTEKLWFDKEGNPTWRFSLAPMLYPTHGLGPFLHMTGDRFTEVTAFSVAGDKPPGAEPGRSWLETAMLRSERGVLFKLLNSFCNAHPGGHYLSLYGDRGSFETGRGRKARSKVHHWKAGGEGDEMTEESHDYPPLPPYVSGMGSHAGPAVSIIEDFVASIQKQLPSPIGPILAAKMTLPGIAALESIKSGTTVAVPDPSSW